MYVAPDTNLILIKNCPLAVGLEHTILFESAGAQQAYFAGLASVTLSDYSFQRVNIGIVRVSVSWNECIGYNYIAFQNHAHGNKWFYGFIVNHEYVNEGCTAIFYEIDPIQTYMFDWTLGSCLIKRETTPTDKIGDYLLDEGLDTGQPIIASSSNYYMDFYWLIGSTADLMTDSFPDVVMNTNVYDNQAVSYQIYACTGSSFVNNILSALESAGKISAVQFLYPFPKNYITLVGEASSLGVWNVYINSQAANMGMISRPTEIDGYEPKNNKLFLAPYVMARVVSSSGSSNVFEFERSGIDGTISLETDSSMLPSSTARCYPKNYDNLEKNYLESVILAGTPLGAFNYDVFTNWYALNHNKRDFAVQARVINLGRRILGGELQAGEATLDIENRTEAFARKTGMTNAQASAALGSGVATGAAWAGFAYNAVNDMADFAIDMYSEIAAMQDMKTIPATAAGAVELGDANIARKTYGFMMQVITIRAEYARVIDDYFSRFGYRVMETKVPTLHNRDKWDYIQCLDAEISGNIPAVAIQQIKRCFQRGITFWHSASTFGDYSQTNNPIG